MIIYCIVVITSIQTNENFSASLRTEPLNGEPHLKKLHENVTNILSLIHYCDGIHMLRTSDAVYYANLNDDQLTLFAVDESLSIDHLHSLLLRISLASNAQDLEMLINNPVAAIKSKLDEINEALARTFQELRVTTDKLVERGVSINELLAKTDKLSADAERFSACSAKRKKRVSCLGLFSGFSSVRELALGDGCYEAYVRARI